MVALSLEIDPSDRSLTIRKIFLKEVDSELKASIEIPGFAPMSSLQRFRPMPPVQYAMTVATPDGSSISRNDLFRNNRGMVFTIFGDGLSLSKAQAEKLDVHFTLEAPFGNRLELKQHLNSDGTFTCIPMYTKGWSVPNRGIWNWLVSWPVMGVPTGELKVSAGIGEGVFQTLATGKMQVEQESWLRWSANIFLPILTLIYILGLFLKRKFPRGLKVRSIDVVKAGVALISPGPNWSVHKLRRFTIRSLIPFYHNSVKVRGVMFHARPGGYVGVRVKDVGAQSCEMDSAMIQDNIVVNYLTSQLSDSFVPQEPEELKHIKYKDFTSGDVLFNTQNAQNGRIFKFTGEK